MQQGQSKPVPRLGNRNREFRHLAIVGADTRFIQSTSVITTEAFEEILSKPRIFLRPVRQLMAVEVIQTARVEHLFVWGKRSCQSLRDDVCYNVAAVRAGVYVT